ncbi:MAG: cyclic nucleotide-binding domain-containing protein, partial [Candidatus Dadabacteria bacterium]|nr:cyclic nucleotide-binding domain-containing protein [Candidatus Dadabacteria bacterium]NIQ17075.1 cyclic nucleotide-binding domain-containing protein [Candidatus Dadabacteria bacterium]
HVVGEIFPGQFFGEMSLLTGEPRSATITAVTDVIVFEIAKDDVENLFRRRASLLEDISQIVAERRASNIAAIESLSAQQTEQH